LRRWVLAASGGVASFVTLLPAVIAGLILLFDVSAHGLLGMSGTLLDLATPFGGAGGGGGGLPSYHGVAVDLPRAIGISMLRGLPPVAMIVLAVVRPRRSPRRHWIAATVAAVLACLTAGWPALPGLVSAAMLAAAGGARPKSARPRSCSPPAAGSDPS
jgi:hypothetical protein